MGKHLRKQISRIYRRPRWSARDLVLLRSRYGRRDWSIQQIADALGRPYWATRRKAARMGLRRPRPRSDCRKRQREKNP